MNSDRKVSIYLFKILPTCLLSRLFGSIARIRLPQFLINKIIPWYCAKFGVITCEYEVPEKGFERFDQFFTRKLKSGVRKIDRNKKSIVSPVDARIDSHGKIEEGTLLQAKGITYRLEDLVPSEISKKFLGGYFVTLYLSPGDYHRIHSPVTGKIAGFFHIPGRLFTVQEYMAKGLPGLFSLNERLITYIKTAKGMIAVCKIGAMNVGRISLSYEDIITNKKMFRKRHERLYGSKDLIAVKSGEEIGVFHLGSTIILLVEKSAGKLSPLKHGSKIRLGSKIGALN